MSVSVQSLISAIVDRFQAEPGPFLLGAAGLLLLSLLLSLWGLVRSWRLARRLSALFRGRGDLDLEGLLVRQATLIERALAEAEEVRAGQGELRRSLRACVRRVGLVRFNAFPDSGGELSFALALLDDDLNGVVVSSLAGRDDSRVYAKPVEAGKSPYPLSREEQEAINRAAAGKKG